LANWADCLRASFHVIVASGESTIRHRDERKRDSAEKTLRNIRRVTRRHFSAEDKIRIVLLGLREEDSVVSETRLRHDAELCRREGINQNLYYRWSKEFLEASKKRLARDTVREATSDKVKDLRAEARQLKETLAELLIESRLLKKSVIEGGRAIHEILRTREAGDYQSGRAAFAVGTAHTGPARPSHVDLLSLVRPLCARRAQCT